MLCHVLSSNDMSCIVNCSYAVYRFKEVQFLCLNIPVCGPWQTKSANTGTFCRISQEHNLEQKPSCHINIEILRVTLTRDFYILIVVELIR